MAGTVSAYQQGTLSTPVEGGSLDASVVVANDNAVGGKHNSHDADATIHVQSSALASRPSAGTAQRFWVTTDGLRAYLDSGSVWGELAYLPLVGGTMTGDLKFTDATYDIGKSGATRPRDFFLSRNATIGGTLGVTGLATLTAGFASTAASTTFVASSTTPVLTAGTGTVYPTGLSTAGSIVAVVGSTVNARFVAVAGENSVSAAGRFIGAVCGGTVASPTATPSGADLASFTGRGYDTTNLWYASDQGGMVIRTTQSWTNTAHGTQVRLSTVPNGSTTATAVLVLDQDASATFAGAVSGITTLGMSGALTIGTTITNSSGDLDINANGANAVRINRSSGTGGFTVFAGGTATSNFTVSDGGAATVRAQFGCNGAGAQSAYASGGALAAYGAGANGLDSGANMSALHALVVNIRAALVANGIMS